MKAKNERCVAVMTTLSIHGIGSRMTVEEDKSTRVVKEWLIDGVMVSVVGMRNECDNEQCLRERTEYKYM